MKKKQHLYPIILTVLFLLQATVGYAATASNISSPFIINCKAEQNYGLHSYYLFNKQPVFNAHTAALKQIEFLLRKISKVKKLYANGTTNQQHGIYIPVSFKPQSWILQASEKDFSAAARWVVHNYDYQCAKKLLKAFPSASNKGPYFLSSLEQLQIKSDPNSPWRSPILIQDLSDIDTSKSVFWITAFVKKSWQPRQWQLSDLPALRDRLLDKLKSNDSVLNGQTNTASLVSQNDPPLAENTPSKIPPNSATPLLPKKFNHSMEYPITEFLPTQPNPYSDKITIRYRQN